LGRAWKEVLGGWSINGIYTYMSGEPFSVRSGVRTSNNSHESRAVLIGAKPEVELQQKAGVVGPVLFADNSAFRIPAPGQNGDGRNTFTSVGYWNLDSGISKRFDITERVRLQLRTEFFNLLNHPNFDNPGCDGGRRQHTGRCVRADLLRHRGASQHADHYSDRGIFQGDSDCVEVAVLKRFWAANNGINVNKQSKGRA
jgi:hypothetical protein